MAIPSGKDDARRRLRALIDDYRGGRFLNPVQPSGPVRPITMEEVRQIRVPTLVIIGEYEVPFLQIVARALAYSIPGARLSVIPGGGHMINLIEPAGYNATVERFLEEAITRR